MPRLFPWRGRVGALPASAGFSWSNPQLVDGVEYARLVRTFMAPLIVVVGAALLARRAAFFTAPDAVETACAAALAVLFVVERALVLRSRRRKAEAAS